MTEPISLADFREEKFLRGLERGKYPALAAGRAPVRKLMAWMEEGGMFDLDISALLIYNAAAEIFRNADSPQQAKRLVSDIVRGRAYRPEAQRPRAVMQPPP